MKLTVTGTAMNLGLLTLAAVPLLAVAAQFLGGFA